MQWQTGPDKRGRRRLGDGSESAKSVIAAVLPVALSQGVESPPFKAQNMSLNSFVTAQGGEIGRAQALQAEACGIPAHVDMNPILLKPESDRCSQVIVHGQVWGKYEARAYFERTQDLLPYVCASYERLAKAYEIVVIEGAGSAAEMNLRDRDLANWAIAEFADAAVILVADIDRGGVFAQVIGTIDLLSVAERRRLAGIIVNKFRGDSTLLQTGSLSWKPVPDCLPRCHPFLRDLDWPGIKP